MISDRLAGSELWDLSVVEAVVSLSNNPRVSQVLIALLDTRACSAKAAIGWGLSLIDGSTGPLGTELDSHQVSSYSSSRRFEGDPVPVVHRVH